ncbi:hypothetical protein HZH68_014887 [Vespula germanica]|uniref:Uncharacterized protein n=1 Tax=Vespula germanica TaxID=30212 RepID=A0A834J6W8_VESGE|nr:hypothetical protein HZH68_014887 [Vespula germanica]
MVCSSAKRNHVGSQDGAGPEWQRPRESLFIKGGVVGGRNLEKVDKEKGDGGLWKESNTREGERSIFHRKGKREEKSGEAGGEELLYDTDLAVAIPSGLGVPEVHSTYKIRCWWCVGVDDGDACSGRCGFRRVTTLGYGVSRWPSVEGAPRGLIGAPRIDPIT